MSHSNVSQRGILIMETLEDTKTKPHFSLYFSHLSVIQHVTVGLTDPDTITAAISSCG